MVKEIGKDLENFKSIFKIFRYSTGYSGEKFGELLGLTRQSINNMETGRHDIKLCHYYSIRYIFQEKLKQPEFFISNIILKVFIDYRDKFTKKELETLENDITYLAFLKQSNGPVKDIEDIKRLYECLVSSRLKNKIKGVIQIENR